MNAALGFPRVYLEEPPRPKAPEYSHPLQRNTALYMELLFCYTVLHMPYEQWLAQTSKYERRLAMKFHSLHLLKEAYANSPKDERAKFPA